MLTELRAALAAADWVRALGLALDAWRTTRAPALADLVEVIGRRVKPPRVPRRIKVLHGWWLARAILRDPADLDALLESLDHCHTSYDNNWKPLQARWAPRANRVMTPLLRDPRGSLWNRDLFERVAELVEWPDDPRIAKALADRFLFQDIHVRWIDPTTATWITQAIVDRIAEIGDLRVLDDIGVKAKHQMLVVRVRSAFDKRGTPQDPGPLLAECIELARPRKVAPVPRADLDDLWHAVSANPSDIGTRAVLGDALAESGDLRGELIVLQCNAKTPNRPLRARRTDRYDGRTKTLIRMHWREWLGPLADILQKSSVFRCGMLEVARVGRHHVIPADSTWTEIRGHRELGAVHTVRPGWVTGAKLAEFVLALQRDPERLVAHDPMVLVELARARTRFATTRLDCHHWISRPSPANQPGTLDLVTKLFPDLEQLVLDVEPSTLGAPALRAVRDMLPKLATLRVTARTLTPSARAELKSAPWIEVVNAIDESG